MTDSDEQQGERTAAAVRATVLRETHRFISDAADGALDALAAGRTELFYPPGDGVTDANRLTDGEVSALRGLAASDLARSGMRKLVRAAAAGALFELFTLLDGVADPQDGNGELWLGAELVPPTGDEDREMLHDEFLDSYWHAAALAGGGSA